MLSSARQRAMDRVSLLAETNAVEYAKSRREDIIALAKMGIENYVAQWEKQIQSEAERRAYAELSAKWKFDQAAADRELLKLSVDYYIATWKSKVESELAALQYAAHNYKIELEPEVKNAELEAQHDALGAQARGAYQQVFAALEATKVQRGEALARLAQTNTNAAQDFALKVAQIDQQAQIDYRNRFLETEKLVLARDDMVNKNNLQVAVENENNRYKTADVQTKVYVVDAQVYGSKASAYTQMGELAYKINVDPARIEAEYNLKKTELAQTSSIGQLVDLIQVYAQLCNALYSASDVSLSSGLSYGVSIPTKYNPDAGEILTWSGPL